MHVQPSPVTDRAPRRGRRAPAAVLSSMLVAGSLWVIGPSQAIATTPPYGGLPIDEPALPLKTMQDWDSSVAANPANQRLVTSTGSIQTALDAAGAAYTSGQGLQIVKLSSNAAYTISSRLTVPNGVLLQGQRLTLTSQVVQPSTGFQQDLEMILLTSNSGIRGLKVDGKNIAWRIVRTTNLTDYTVSDSDLRNTKSSIGVTVGPYFVPGTRPHTDIVYMSAGAQRLLVDKSTLSYAGLSASGGRSNSPTLWSAFAAGVSAESAKDVTVRSSTINETATAGINVWRTERVRIASNTISNVSRNSEWWSPESTVALGDAVTGYNNATISGANVEFERHWIIENNTVTNSGNNGIHVSGMTIYVAGNKLNKIQQVGLFVGGTLTTTDNYDCVEQVLAPSNTRDALRYTWKYRSNSTLPNYYTDKVRVRHYVHNGTTLVVSTSFTPTPVVMATAPDERDCDVRMADPGP